MSKMFIPVLKEASRWGPGGPYIIKPYQLAKEIAKHLDTDNATKDEVDFFADRLLDKIESALMYYQLIVADEFEGRDISQKRTIYEGLYANLWSFYKSRAQNYLNKMSYIKIEKISDVGENKWQVLADEIKSGKLIIYPTDTVYGLGAIISNEQSINNVYQAKSRSFSSPLIALLSSVDKVDEVAKVTEKERELLQKLGEAFWPGALTVILKAREHIPSIMISGGDTIGVRIPNLDLSIKIIELAGGVLATTSANISGEATPKSYDELSDEIKNNVDILVDGGECKLGEASTIIDLTKDVPKILRKGAIDIDEIRKIIGKVE